MVVVTGRLAIDSGDVDRFLSLVEDVVAATHGEEAVGLYAFSRDLHDPTVFHIVEEWASQEALDAHVRSDHYRAWAAGLREVRVRERDVRIYTVASRTVR